MLVSVPKQVMHVYRNGILIGRSTVSTGSTGTGHAAPGGVFYFEPTSDKRIREHAETRALLCCGSRF